MSNVEKILHSAICILHSRQRQAGFTLIELLIVTSIIGVLLTTGLASYSNFNRKRTVREAALELLNNFRYAQEKALSGEKPSSGCTTLDGWKLEFDGVDYDYKIQAICDGGIEAGDAKTFSFPTGISRSPGPDSFLFKVLAQGVISSGEEILLSGFSETYKIKVTESGEISDEGFQP